MDVQRQSGFVGELLQLKLPQPHPHAIGAAAIGRDRQFAHIGIALASHRRTPVTDRLDRKLGSVAGDADADPTFIGAHIVNTVGHRLAQLLIGKIVHIDALWRAFWTPVGAGVLEVAEQLFLLGIDRDHRLPGSLRSQYLRVDVLELRIAVGVMGTLIGLAVGLPAKAQLRQQPLDAAGADGVTEAAQRSTKLLFDTHSKGRVGEPSVAGSTSRRRSSSRVSSVSVSGRRPPPFWRTCPVGSAGASSSLSPRKPGNLGNRRLAAPARRTRLGSAKQPLATLVKLRANKLPAQPNPLLVDHPNADTAAAPRWESHRPESHQRRVEHQSIQLF